MTEETKIKISEGCKRNGVGKWMLGRKIAPELVEKRASKLRGRKKPPFSEEWKRNLSKSHKGQKAWNKGLHPDYMQKENHHAWKGGITTIDNKERARFRATVQKLIFERDDYTCQVCGTRGVALQVDHIQSWKDYVELRFSMDNCRTLCQKCHYQITFGKPMSDNVKTWGHNLKQIERMVV